MTFQDGNNNKGHGHHKVVEGGPIDDLKKTTKSKNKSKTRHHPNDEDDEVGGDLSISVLEVDETSSQTSISGSVSTSRYGGGGDYVARGLAKEERWVVYSRWLVFVVLVTAAIVVGFETYRITTQQQKDAFVHDVS